MEAIYTGSKDGKFIRYPAEKMAKGYNPADRDWYKQAVENKGKVIITNPYKTASTGTMVITIAKQTEDGSGVVAVNMKIDELIKATERVNIGKSGFAFISSNDKNMLPIRQSKPEPKAKATGLDKCTAVRKAIFNIHLKEKKRKWLLRRTS